MTQPDRELFRGLAFVVAFCGLMLYLASTNAPTQDLDDGPSVLLAVTESSKS